jgi:sporulation-control protein
VETGDGEYDATQEFHGSGQPERSSSPRGNATTSRSASRCPGSRADVERGRVHGVQQALPFYHEIEFYPAPQYHRALNQLEVTFLATPTRLQVVLEIDKRGGVFSEGHDASGRFDVDYASAERTEWTAPLDGWLQRSVRRRGLFS